MSVQYGTIIDVSTEDTGEHLVADAAISATTLFLADVSVFDETGGQVTVNAEGVYYYSAIDLTLNTITLTTGLVAAAFIDDRVELFPPAPVKLAMIDFDINESEAVQAVVPHNLAAVIADGLREEPNREVVLLEERSPGELWVKDLLAKETEVLPYSLRLVDGIDLDSVGDPGRFLASTTGATAGLNYPVPWAGTLEVFAEPNGANNQRYTAYRNEFRIGPSVWVRSLSATWSAWEPVNDDTGWINTISAVAVASTGWTIDSAEIRRVNKHVQFRIWIDRTGADITVPVHGDIVDSDLFQFVAAWRPGGSVVQGVVAGSSGRTLAAAIQADGIVVLTAVGAGSNISVDFAIAGTYLMNY